MESIQEKVKKNLKKLIPRNKRSSVLVAFSGGKDSMSMLNILIELKNEFEIDISVAYVNHNLRGDESSEEDKFVSDYTKSLNLPFYKKIIDKNQWNNLKRESIEMAARKFRYEFFNSVVSEKNIDFIITAHNLNDNIETFFLKLLRSSGIETLSGIPTKNRNIIRPLLNVMRHEIDNYIKTKNLPFVEDSSNKKNIYKRNIIRNKIIPVLSEIQPGFEKNLESFFGFIKEEKLFVKKTMEKSLNKIKVFESEEYISISKDKFNRMPVFNKKYIIKIILDKLDYPAKPDKYLFSNLLSNKKINYNKTDLRCLERGNLLWFINLKKIKPFNSIIQINTIPYHNLDEKINLKLLKKSIINPNTVFAFSIEKINYPIYIRQMEKEDSIITTVNIKIEKILKNMKIPSILFNETGVISDGKKVIGFFLNDIFRVSKDFYIKSSDDMAALLEISKN